jgi:hypothetical protein
MHVDYQWYFHPAWYVAQIMRHKDMGVMPPHFTRLNIHANFGTNRNSA